MRYEGARYYAAASVRRELDRMGLVNTEVMVRLASLRDCYQTPTTGHRIDCYWELLPYGGVWRHEPWGLARILRPMGFFKRLVVVVPAQLLQLMV